MSAVAAASLTLAFSGATAMAASAPTMKVTPSSGLSDGATVSVTGAGFAKNTPVFLAECAQVKGGTVVCNSHDVKVVATTADGKIPSTSLTVRKTFKGYTPDHKLWGTVDCSTTPNGCVIGAATDKAPAGARTAITFKK
ncbi:enediyne antibiotic chromoprotein [Streptomyces sp. NPDC048483]|uniref:enediyne antibiotic chromoprotein n=1 Tax=Streptomyces sp. NPDC048483 TaxID=3154927 RepID=UPI0034410042